MGRILIAGLLLVLGLPVHAQADDTIAGQKKKTLDQLFVLDKFGSASVVPVVKLSEVDDTIVAEIIADSASGMVVPPGDVPRISKWSVPLRVSVQDAQGKDLDLTIAPGREIAKYLADLANVAQVPLTLTTVAKRDNNVSIVVVNEDKMPIGEKTIKQFASNVGAVMGGKGLRTVDRIPSAFFTDASNWKSVHTRYEDLDPNVYWGKMRDAFEIKSCIIVLESYLKWHPERALQVLTPAMGGCLGMSDTAARRRDVHMNSAAWILIREHNFEFLRLLYNKEIKAGMDRPTAEKIFETLAKQAP